MGAHDVTVASGCMLGAVGAFDVTVAAGCMLGGACDVTVVAMG